MITVQRAQNGFIVQDCNDPESMPKVIDEFNYPYTEDTNNWFLVFDLVHCMLDALGIYYSDHDNYRLDVRVLGPGDTEVEAEQRVVIKPVEEEIWETDSKDSEK